MDSWNEWLTFGMSALAVLIAFCAYGVSKKALGHSVKKPSWSFINPIPGYPDIAFDISDGDDEILIIEFETTLVNTGRGAAYAVRARAERNDAEGFLQRVDASLLVKFGMEPVMDRGDHVRLNFRFHREYAKASRVHLMWMEESDSGDLIHCEEFFDWTEMAPKYWNE